jgi:hypothetical protein
VVADGTPLWTSKPINMSRQPQECSVNIGGVEVLELRVDCPGRYEGAYAVWVEPYIVR